MGCGQIGSNLGRENLQSCHFHGREWTGGDEVRNAPEISSLRKQSILFLGEGRLGKEEGWGLEETMCPKSPYWSNNLSMKKEWNQYREGSEQKCRLQCLLTEGGGMT